MTRLPVNPPPGVLGRTHAVIAGRGSRYESRFAGPLSLKSVVRGSAAWETAAGPFIVEPGSTLIINEGEEYTLSIDSLQPVETFCVFFARGFVEDAFRAATTDSATLLDEGAAAPQTGFYERTYDEGPLIEAMESVRRTGLEESLYPLATALVAVQTDLNARVTQLPALRAATRQELHRRLARATEYIHANLGATLRLEDVAGAACLSPFHFHRLFRSLRGETPHGYITRKRLQRARSLLRATTRSIAEIAFDCGFASIGSFTALFARTFGVPPGRFRKNGEAPSNVST
jgi:AraC-like DNA-binding protein